MCLGLLHASSYKLCRIWVMCILIIVFHFLLLEFRTVRYLKTIHDCYLFLGLTTTFAQEPDGLSWMIRKDAFRIISDGMQGNICADPTSVVLRIMLSTLKCGSLKLFFSFIHRFVQIFVRRETCFNDMISISNLLYLIRKRVHRAHIKFYYDQIVFIGQI